ncbi:Protein MOS2 [Striga hermonthica]|uniref:Protein MOS2 n=1 Tax=Striga hermonthica TaxID=68872 RepID=A0A9N7MWV9_STRHE|nr:Protein MOS2 [Striga hermonthica]
MSVSFSLNTKPQSNRLKKATDLARTDSPTRNYVSEFRSGDAPPSPDSKIKPIPPLPDQLRPYKKLKNLPNLPALSQPNGDDRGLQFELDPSSYPEASDSSMGYGLNVRQQSLATRGHDESVNDFELRKLREDLEKLPEATGMDEFSDVPVEGFGAALLSGYGWKEGQGIGRNAKEDVKIPEVTRKAGRGGLGFTDELPTARAESNTNAGKNNKANTNGERKKERETLGLGKKVRIVNGRDMGTKGKIVEVKNGGDLLVLRISGSDDKVRVRCRDVAEVGSAEEERCVRKLKELKLREREVEREKKPMKKRGEEEEKGRGSRRVNWLRNQIRVRIISRELKGGGLFSQKGVVMDVVGPGTCDVLIDKSRELVQEVDQEFLETALPTRGGPVIVLFGRHKGVYGSLVEKDLEKETGVVRDADTHDLLNVTLDQIAEYVGDPTDIGY